MGDSINGIYTSTNLLSTAFTLLSPKEAVFESPNDASSILLDSPRALFTPLKSHALYQVGSAADWINLMTSRKIVAKVQTELMAVPKRR